MVDFVSPRFAAVRFAAVRFAAIAFVVMSLADVAPAENVTVSAEEMRLIRHAEAQRADAIDRVYGTVVSIFGPDKQGGGSGVVFDPGGFVLTNHHVVAAIGKQGTAGLAGAKLYDWQLIGTDPAGDIAIIQLLPPDDDKQTWAAAELGNSDTARVGDWVMAMGNPFVLATDYSPTVTLGIVSGVQRYQGGGMVYGDCLQVDSAINPGNSGGPLINMQSQVIGINGRAAFAERGRVNVGVGFAVSINQVRNFIPSLMACKVAQHGTLDALFGMRNGEVICEAINVDSRAARAGLQLGDQLVSVNSQPIKSANQLANLVSTMPADWPVSIVYEHRGKQFDFAIRLSPITSRSQQPQPAPIEESQDGKDKDKSIPDEPKRSGNRDKDKDKNKNKKEEEKPKTEEGRAKPEDADDEQSSKDRMRAAKDRERVAKARNELGSLIPGSVLSTEWNSKNTRRLLDRWRATAMQNTNEPIAIAWKDQCRSLERVNAHPQADAISGKNNSDSSDIDCWVTTNGLFMLEQSGETMGRSPEGFFSSANGETQALTIQEALADVSVLSVAIQAARWDEELLQMLGQPEIDGGDLVDGQPVYRLKFSGEFSRPLYVWLSQDLVPRLVKAGFDKNGTTTRHVLQFAGHRQHGPFELAFDRQRVTGVAARVRQEWIGGEPRITAIPNELRSTSRDE